MPAYATDSSPPRASADALGTAYRRFAIATGVVLRVRMCLPVYYAVGGTIEFWRLVYRESGLYAVRGTERGYGHTESGDGGTEIGCGRVRNS
eukprot:3549259-Rhodomonas_salina.1